MGEGGWQPDAQGLLTSNTRSFQMGVPSFEMGAVGADTPLDWGSSFPVDSRVSLRLRIFLIETANRVHISWGGGSQGVGCRRVGGAYQSACRAAKSPAPPWLTTVTGAAAGVLEGRSWSFGVGSEMPIAGHGFVVVVVGAVAWSCWWLLFAFSTSFETRGSASVVWRCSAGVPRSAHWMLPRSCVTRML